MVMLIMNRVLSNMVLWLALLTLAVPRYYGSATAFVSTNLNQSFGRHYHPDNHYHAAARTSYMVCLSNNHAYHICSNYAATAAAAAVMKKKIGSCSGDNRKVAFGGSSLQQTCSLYSSFYNDFEDFDNGDNEDKDKDKDGNDKDDDEDEDEDDDEDDGDDYIDFDDDAIAKFRSKLGSGTEQKTKSTEEDIDDDIDEDEDDDDEYPTDSSSSIPQSDLSSISSVEDLISFATSTSTDSPSNKKDEPPTDWALPIDTTNGLGSVLDAGVVLIANPAKFCTDFPSLPTDTSTSTNTKSGRPSPALLTKFGLTLPPPPELGPDRRADLLPVLLLLERHPLKGCQALLLNRRTGYLIGDLDQQQQQQQQSSADRDDDDEPPAPTPPSLGAFMIQPLWFGGTSSGGEPMGGRGFDMVHLCPNVDGAKRITEDGLYWGGDPAQAQEEMGDPENGAGRILTGFDFKFFVQSTRWLPTQLEKEIRDGTWILASVSKDVMFKSRDRLGSKRAKPLWTEVMESMGGEYKDIRDLLYGDE